MNLLYFVERDSDKGLGDSFLSDHGLSHAFDSLDMQITPAVMGGSKGVILAHQGTDRLNQYKPEHQRWIPMPGTTTRVGMWTDQPQITPEQLERPTMLDGLPLDLADGHTWSVPTVRVPINPPSAETVIRLPRAMTLDPAGNWIQGEIIQRNKWLLDLVTPYWDAWQPAFLEFTQSEAENASEVEFSSGVNVFDCATKILSANYHVSAAECALLGLFTNRGEATDVINYSLGIPVVLSWWNDKKKERAENGSASTPGHKDAPSTTPQPSHS